MLLSMEKPNKAETWKTIGSVARILAGKLLVARELEKMAAAPTGESGGQVTLGESPNAEGNRTPTATGRNAVGGLQTPPGRHGLQIGGHSLAPISGFQIVGAVPAWEGCSCAPARRRGPPLLLRAR